MASTKEEARLAGRATSEKVVADDVSEDSPAAAERQAFFETLVSYDKARLPLLLARDHLERRGLGDDGIAAACCLKVRQLNRIASRGGTLTDLPAERSILPPWARELTPKLREERDRRRGGRWSA